MSPHRTFLVKGSTLCALTVALLPQAGASGQDDRPARPNIVFVLSDDHAAHAVSAYGSTRNETPSLDRLAREGVMFERYYCANSICAPARASILTGLHSGANGVRTNADRLDPGLATFPALLKGAGYETALFGKWHLKAEPTGFDTWAVLPGQGDYYNPELRTDGGERELHGYVTDVVTDLALDWLEQREGNAPFLLCVQHKAPHRPWMPGPDELTLYRDEDMPEPDTLFDDYASRTTAAARTAMTIRDHFYGVYDLKLDTPLFQEAAWEGRGLARLDEEQRGAWERAYSAENEAFRASYEAGELSEEEVVRWKYQRYVKDYLRCVAGVDKNVGRLMDYLDANDLADNTLFVYTSDQGFFLGEHGWYDKRWMYEESFRSPLLMRWPTGTPAGLVRWELAQNIDLAPTFLELAGVEHDEAFHGRSLAPLVTSEATPPWTSAIYYHYFETPSEHVVPAHYGVRAGRYKLIHYYEIDEWELFDLNDDPAELRNVVAERSKRRIVPQLQEEIVRLRHRFELAPPPVESADRDEGGL